MSDLGEMVEQVSEHDHEFYSDCCGALTGSEMRQWGFCPQCKEHAGFECECGAVYVN